MYILILYCISLIHHSGTANNLVCPQFQNVSINSHLESRYSLLHVIINKDVRHLIDMAGPNFYQFMNPSIFSTQYKVSKCKGEERFWISGLFWTLTKIRDPRDFDYVLDIPPRHPYVYTSFKLEEISNPNFHFLLFANNSREILGVSVFKTVQTTTNDGILRLLCKYYEPLSTNVTTQSEVDQTYVQIKHIRRDNSIGFGVFFGCICLGCILTIAIAYRRMCRH